MKLKATLDSVVFSPFRGETSITFKSFKYPSEEIEDLVHKEVSLNIKKIGEDRTDNQLRYVWEMMTQLATKKKRTAYEEYEDFLRATPLFYTDKDGKYETVYLKKGAEPRKGQNLHWLWLQDVEVQEKKGRRRTATLSIFARIRGMSSFNREEMSDFIENVVFECKQNGIETLTPDEIQQMETYVKD